MSGLDAQMVVRRDGFRLDAELTIEPGRTVALLGPNGSGKSTVVAALAGLLPIDEGRIVLDGAVFDDPSHGVFVPPEERRVGVVFQDYLLFPHLSVVENVEFGLRSRGVGRSSASEAAAVWLERLGIGDLARRRPRDLSGGQAQRVALARALVTGPKMLLLDEPLAALDATTRVEMRRVLADHLAVFEGPRLFITHDPTEAFLLADELHIIEGGRITQVGTVDDIRLRPRTAYIADLGGSNLFFGEAAGGAVDVGGHLLRIADSHISGPVLATVHAQAISLHAHRPGGSPRNAWETTVTRIEHFGDRVRVQTGPPLPVTAEVTPGAVGELQLREGSSVWVSIKATEIGVQSG